LRHLVTATWDDVPHLSASQKQQLWDALPPHEKEARSKGIPGLGEGAIFPVSDESILVDPFEIPKHWRQIGGIDFGYDHPFAATKLAHDLDTDTVYVTAEYRERKATPVIHAAALRPWGKWLPWAWPHDGLQHDKGSGEQLAQQYRDQEMVFKTCPLWMEEKRLYHRKKNDQGKIAIVALRDDLISASRYGLMMIRHAVMNQVAFMPQVDNEWVR
jgi:hypothetical protein